MKTERMKSIFSYFFIISLFYFIFSAQVDTASAMSVVVHVPEKYTDVLAGERFYFELEIKYPENPSRKDLRIEYEIIRNKETIAQSKVLKAVETQVSFMDYMVIPQSAEKGIYEIRVRITDYDGKLDEEASASFNVIRSGNQLQIYFFIIVGLIIILGIIISLEVNRIKKRL
ncbi:MAG: hypothetical protein HGB08_02990 [Candidatus Moranbacteria bacterium]|nr:hypothetical protein [Candidatus Moranbacteria bacterium]